MTATVPPPPMPPPPIMRAPPPPPPPVNGTVFKFKPSSGPITTAQKIGVYGTGGSGKSSLVGSLSQIGIKPLFLDIGDGSKELDVDRIGPADGLDSWDALRAAVNDRSLWNGYGALVIDDMTKAQDACAQGILKKENVDSLESACGGYGKGYRKLYDQVLALIGDLERHTREGRHVVLIMHEFVVPTPNPEGEDYKTFMPNLYQSDKASIRHRIKEEVDHLIFIGYDVSATKGKAKGSGTRTIYVTETPTHWAKTRRLDRFSGPMVYEKGSAAFWQRLLGDNNGNV